MLNSDYKDMLQVLLDKIDLISGITGVSFDQAYQRRQIVTIDGLSVPILSREDLIKNKRATGRDKDRLDADRLDRGNL